MFIDDVDQIPKSCVQITPHFKIIYESAVTLNLNDLRSLGKRTFKCYLQSFFLGYKTFTIQSAIATEYYISNII